MVTSMDYELTTCEICQTITANKWQRVLRLWQGYLHRLVEFSMKRPGPRFNIKMSSYQYRKSHCGDKTVVRSSYLHSGISYTGKMASFFIESAPCMYVVMLNHYRSNYGKEKSSCQHKHWFVVHLFRYRHSIMPTSYSHHVNQNSVIVNSL